MTRTLRANRWGDEKYSYRCDFVEIYGASGGPVGRVQCMYGAIGTSNTLPDGWRGQTSDYGPHYCPQHSDRNYIDFRNKGGV